MIASGISIQLALLYAFLQIWCSGAGVWYCSLANRYSVQPQGALACAEDGWNAWIHPWMTSPARVFFLSLSPAAKHYPNQKGPSNTSAFH